MMYATLALAAVAYFMAGVALGAMLHKRGELRRVVLERLGVRA
jgi:uncharacterized membrane protein YoaK (UPF0700 family)